VTSASRTSYEYRYQITRNGRRVGWIEAEFHGPAVWEVDDPTFVDPGEPRTMEHLDAALYAAGFEVMPDE
jgi:hypothetical protein